MTKISVFGVFFRALWFSIVRLPALLAVMWLPVAVLVGMVIGLFHFTSIGEDLGPLLAVGGAPVVLQDQGSDGTKSDDGVAAREGKEAAQVDSDGDGLSDEVVQDIFRQLEERNAQSTPAQVPTPVAPAAAGPEDMSGIVVAVFAGVFLVIFLFAIPTTRIIRLAIEDRRQRLPFHLVFGWSELRVGFSSMLVGIILYFFMILTVLILVGIGWAVLTLFPELQMQLMMQMQLLVIQASSGQTEQYLLYILGAYAVYILLLSMFWAKFGMSIPIAVQHGSFGIARSLILSEGNFFRMTMLVFLVVGLSIVAMAGVEYAALYCAPGVMEFLTGTFGLEYAQYAAGAIVIALAFVFVSWQHGFVMGAFAMAYQRLAEGANWLGIET